MAIYSGLFNSINGDRKYDAVWFARYFATFIGNGVFPNPSTGLQVTERDNMTTTVRVGDGWIKGYFIVNDGDYILQHDIADGVLKRIDRVVMRLDYNERKILIEIKKGAFASVPVAPALQRDGDELALADVMISNGLTQITQSNITDLRLNSELCGIVHGIVDQVDTTTIYNQYLDFWETWRTGKMDQFEGFLTDSQDEFDQQTTDNQSAFDNQTIMNQQEFNDWFVTVQGILEGDVAGNLLALINKNADDLAAHLAEIATKDKLGHIKIGDGLTVRENGTVDTNTAELRDDLTELIDRNAYDDYQLWLELYYKGLIGQVEASNAKAIMFDGFMDVGNIGSDDRLEINTKNNTVHPKLNQKSSFFANDVYQYDNPPGHVHHWITDPMNNSNKDERVPLGNSNNERSIAGEFDLGELRTLSTISLGLANTRVDDTIRAACILESLFYSDDGVAWVEYGGNLSGTGTIPGWRGLPASPGTGLVDIELPTSIKAKYVRVYMRVYGRSGEPTIYLYSVVFQNYRLSSGNYYFNSKLKDVPFKFDKARLYVSSHRDLPTELIIPKISVDGGAIFKELLLVGEREDSKFADYMERIYNITELDSDSLILQFNFNNIDNQYQILKRYGLILE